jgi:hypothetical protein
MPVSARGSAARFFDTLVLVTRLTPPMLSRRADLKGLHGVVNFQLTGAGGGSWHCRFVDGCVVFGRKTRPDSRATLRLPAEEFLRLLAEETTLWSLTATGRLKVDGDGSAPMVLGFLSSQFRRIQDADGLNGMFGRWYANRVLGTTQRSIR